MAELDDILVKLDEMNDRQQKMHSALCGTEYGQKGLVERMDGAEKYISKDRKFKTMVAGGLTVLATTGDMIGEKLKAVIKWLPF